MGTGEFPVGVVADTIEKSIGQGHRAGFANSVMSLEEPWTNNNNNNINKASYFPKFDYGQVVRGRGSCWWGASKDEGKKILKII